MQAIDRRTYTENEMNFMASSFQIILGWPNPRLLVSLDFVDLATWIYETTPKT
jgi:hypothetical protein